MPTAIHSFEDDAESTLEAMALSGEVMAEICRRGLAQYHTATPHHPSNAPGSFLYFGLVQAIRDILIPTGAWELAEENLSLVFNEELAIAIAVSSGDIHTGDPSRNPSFKYPKGPTTLAAVAGNANQLGLFDGDPRFADYTLPTTRKRVDFEKFKTWWFLHHVDPNKELMRAELSLPTKIGSSGETNMWESRIILDPISFDEEPDAYRLDDAPDGPDFDVDVRRKA